MKPSNPIKRHGRPTIVLDPKDDGVTHLNVYSSGKTLLGQFLSNLARTPFKHPVYGSFQSIEGFWHWLATGKRHEILRTLAGHDALKTGRKFEKVHLDDFKDEIIKAIIIKIEAYPLMKLQLMQNRLTLTHYFVFKPKEPGGEKIVVDQAKFQWIVRAIASKAKEWRNE